MAEALAPAMGESQVGFTRIGDIRLGKRLSESFCLKQLTSYEAYTIFPDSDDDSKDRNKGEDGRIGRGSSTRNSWDKVQIKQELCSQDEIIETIRTLDTSRRSTASKYASLYSNQRKQVETIVNNKSKKEREICFTWTLAQLYCKFRNLEVGRMETLFITVYIKRTPLSGIDVISLYGERQERAASRQVELRQEKQRQLANQQLGQGMQTNMPQSTVPIQQQRSRNPNVSQTQEPQQQTPSNLDLGLLGSRYQNGNLVPETGQIGALLNTHQSRIRDDYWETKARKQDSKVFDLAVKTRLDGMKAMKARDAALRTPRSNARETPLIQLAPLSSLS